MPSLAHSSPGPAACLWASALGWILLAVSVGQVDWRVWAVSDSSVVTSGLAWVGVWRVCFYTHAPILSADQIMFCQHMRLSEAFTPPEVAAAQVLMLTALILGLMGNAGVIYGLRNVYFGLSEFKPIWMVFSGAGVLLILTGASALVPVCWNLSSVINNHTISFPDSFLMPSAPESQAVGSGIVLGMFASVLLFCSGTVILSYRVPPVPQPKVGPFGKGHSENRLNQQGTDNPAFQTH